MINAITHKIFLIVHIKLKIILWISNFMHNILWEKLCSIAQHGVDIPKTFVDLKN